MYRYKKIVVNIDFNDDIESLLSYASMITKMARTEKLYFVHVVNTLDIPEAIRKTYPELDPIDELSQTKMRELVEQSFKNPGDTKVFYEVLQGKPLDELLNFIRRKDIDLVLNNGKNPDTHSLEIAEKLARKAPCSVLLVPQGNKAKISKVLVAVDFSEHSSDAIDIGIAYASAAGLSEIHCLHAYNVPMGYYKTGKSFEAFAEIMHQNAAALFEEYITGFDLKGLKVKPMFVLNEHPEAAIQDAVHKEHFDLLVLGSRGRSTGAAVLLGSVTEKLLWSTAHPLLAVKKKGTGLKVLEVLFNV